MAAFDLSRAALMVLSGLSSASVDADSICRLLGNPFQYPVRSTDVVGWKSMENSDEVQFAHYVMRSVRDSQAAASCCYCYRGWTHDASEIYRYVPSLGSSPFSAAEAVDLETDKSLLVFPNGKWIYDDGSKHLEDLTLKDQGMFYLTFHWKCDGLGSKQDGHQCVDAIVAEVLRPRGVLYSGFYERHIDTFGSHFAGAVLYEDKARFMEGITPALVVRLERHGVDRFVFRIEVAQQGHEAWDEKKYDFILKSSGEIFSWLGYETEGKRRGGLLSQALDRVVGQCFLARGLRE